LRQRKARLGYTIAIQDLRGIAMDIGALFKNSWEKFSANIGMGIVIFIVGAIVAGLAAALTFGIVSVPIYAGIFKAMRTIQRGGNPDFGDIFSEFSNFAKWFQLWLLGLVIFVVIFVCSLVLNLIPVIGQLTEVVIGLGLGFFLFYLMPLMLEQNMGAFDAAKASFDYVKSNIGMLVGPILLTLIVSNVFTIITGPWMAVQIWCIYDDTMGAAQPTGV
jgi:uncharacterized membrane protein